MKIKLPLQDNEYTISIGYKTAFVTKIKSPITIINDNKYLDRKHKYKPYGRVKK